jgi:hypothetical protein
VALLIAAEGFKRGMASALAEVLGKLAIRAK